ncbi:Phosphatidylethanolamine-binding protein 1 [Coemansia sp. Benny D160-2]|nr:Phosphatidylethanolamine-binding protein 1 [Coemansia sp. Benny D160-2]
MLSLPLFALCLAAVPLACASDASSMQSSKLNITSLHIGPDPSNPMAPYMMTERPSSDSPKALTEIRDRLQEAHILPDILPPSFMPEFSLSLRYAGLPVSMGQLLSLNNTVGEPTIEFDAPNGDVFAATIVDPDAPAPARHGYRSYRHFLAANLDAQPNSTSDVLTTYQAPHLSPNSGAHRYAVIVFRQAKRVDFNPGDVPRSRVRFDSVQWAKSHKMSPVAATYFTVQNFASTP